MVFFLEELHDFPLFLFWKFGVFSKQVASGILNVSVVLHDDIHEGLTWLRSEQTPLNNTEEGWRLDFFDQLVENAAVDYDQRKD